MLLKPLSEIFPNPPADVDPHRLDPDRVPQHVAVIMDGNGRWAKKRALNRLRGHNAGIEAVRETIRCAHDVGVRYLTIYSFSTENWKRSQEEVDGLMTLFAKTMLAEVDGLDEENVRVRTIGDLSRLPQATRDAFDEAWEQTKDNTGMTLVVAVNYGGREEIMHAVQACAAEAVAEAAACAQQTADGALAEHDAPAARGTSTTPVPPITEAQFASHLYTADMPDPDLLIRTSGELRISNFLLWQVAYAEFYSTDVLWPDFDRYDFLRALLDYQGRDRRFGGAQ